MINGNQPFVRLGLVKRLGLRCPSSEVLDPTARFLSDTNIVMYRYFVRYFSHKVRVETKSDEIIFPHHVRHFSEGAAAVYLSLFLVC